MTDGGAALLAEMAKHLPPSGARLRLLDVGGRVGPVWAALRADLDITPVQSAVLSSIAEAASVDAIALYGSVPDSALLDAALRALRAGGRLILLLPEAPPGREWVDLLEAHGYTRILVEGAGSGALVRGEKPHTTADTLARVRVASSRDDRLTDLERYPGRYLYLLIHQQPNKPVWALREGEPVTWEALALPGERPALVAFSSLAKAVAFMQPAVLAGHIRDINKVGKYAASVVRGWAAAVLLNPPDDLFAETAPLRVPVDRAVAEAPDE